VILEERRYTLIPGGVPQYIAHYQALGRESQERHLGQMVGCFQSEVGELNQLVFLWRYENLADREARRTALLADAQFAEFRQRVRGLLVQQKNCILNAVVFPEAKR
jgi:hypothetical protein